MTDRVRGSDACDFRARLDTIVNTVPLLVVLVGCATVNRGEPVDPRPVVHHRAEGADGAALRVATYNVYGASNEELVRAMRAHENLRDADIVFLQEYEDDPAALAEMIDRTVAYAPGYRRGDGGTHGVAIASRLPLGDVRVIELPRYHVVVNSARRIALGATAEVEGREVQLYSVHLDNRINPSDRARQLRPVLVDAAATPRRAAIIAGDMNHSPFCWIGRLVPVPCGRQDDAVERAARRHGFTTPVRDSGATNIWFGMRLDAIYVRGFAVTGYGVDDALRISDHLPLWADVTL